MELDLPFFNFSEKHNGLEIGCKTGTAETNEDDKTHAWFTVYFDPQEQDGAVDKDFIHLTVMVEKSGEGSKVAGPIARAVFDEYFKN